MSTQFVATALRRRIPCSSTAINNIPRVVLLGKQRQFTITTHYSKMLCQGHISARTFGSSSNNKNDILLYESPLGTVVTRLRTVSIATGICGSLGLPLVVSLKGGVLPSTGLLAIGMTFCMMSLGSTAAIHYIFHPYVYEIYKMPVRQCHFNKDGQDTLEEEAVVIKEEPPKGPYLYKAISKSLFLGTVETVFDPDVDLEPYKGLRPMCNFLAKNVPLYVHPQQVHNQELRAALHFLTNIPQAEPTKDNPDDFL